MRIFCSVCKDIFIPYSEVHVTKCGHLYHFSCISTWMKQHKTCPQCRGKTSTTFRVYFDVEKDSQTDRNTLEHELEVTSDKLREAERERKNLQENCSSLMSIIVSMKECALSLTEKNDTLKTSIKGLKVQVTKLTKQNELIPALESEVDMWRSKVETLESIETILKGSAEETNKMVAATPVTELAVKQLCIYVGVLKTQLIKLQEKNNMLVKENREFAKKLVLQCKKDSSELDEIKNLKQSKLKLENDLQTLKKSFEEILKRQSKEEGNVLSHSKDQAKGKRSYFDLNLDFDDFENVNVQSTDPVKEDKSVSRWEILVCAGPSRNAGLSLQKSKFLNKNISNSTSDYNLSSSVYAFDGMGGRKKLRLGGPTPAEEFQKIKKKKEKKSTPIFQHTKIIDFCVENKI